MGVTETLQKKAREYRKKSKQRSISRTFRPRKKYYVSGAVIAIIVLIFFLSSGFLSQVGQRETITLTPIGTSLALDDQTNMVLTRWEYNPTEGNMEIELGINSTHIEEFEDFTYYINLYTNGETETPIRIAFDCDSFVVVQSTQVDPAQYYSLVCSLSISNEGTTDVYTSTFYSAESVMTITDNINMNKTEDEYYLESYSANYSLKETQYNETEYQIQTLNAEIADYQARIDDLEESLPNLTTAEQETANARISRFESIISSDQSRVTSLTNQLRQLEQDMRALQEKASYLS